MRSFIIFAVLLTCGLQRSWGQDTFYLRVGNIRASSPAQTSKFLANRPGEQSLSPDSTLAFRMRDARIRELADTSKFVPNRQGAWSLYSSYLAAAGPDSILLEAAVSHNRDADWSQYQRFGRIRDKQFWPMTTVEARSLLLADVYDIRVEKDGWCFIKLSKGQLPSTDPVVLPIRITFKGK